MSEARRPGIWTGALCALGVSLGHMFQCFQMSQNLIVRPIFKISRFVIE